MFGYEIPDGVFSLLEKYDLIYLGQTKGKLHVIEKETDCVIVVKKKKDDCVFQIDFSERLLMNKIKKPLVTIGSSKDMSEVFMPDRYFEDLPYEGRPFLHGFLDCYTLIRDYYRKELDIILPTNMQRNWEWWNEGSNLYVDNAKNYGFKQVSDIKKYDILVMSLNSSVPNHGAIYLGDNKILHHIGGRFSTIEDYTSTFKHTTSTVYRNLKYDY